MIVITSGVERKQNLSSSIISINKMSNAFSDSTTASAPSSGSGVLVVLKQKMQNLRDDMEKYKDMYEEKCQEADSERSRRNEV